MTMTQYNSSITPLIDEILYRVPRCVTDYTFFLASHTSYARCPSCQTFLEREYQSFCDQCGQCLEWPQSGPKVIHLR